MFSPDSIGIDTPLALARRSVSDLRFHGPERAPTLPRHRREFELPTPITLKTTVAYSDSRRL